MAQPLTKSTGGKEYGRSVERRPCPWAYPDFVETISNPDHRRHEEVLEWVGGEFDPERFDLEAVNNELWRMRLRTP
jgi:pRiA4b ORF-3-like protein